MRLPFGISVHRTRALREAAADAALARDVFAAKADAAIALARDVFAAKAEAVIALAGDLLTAKAEGRLIVTDYPYAPRSRKFEESRSGLRLAEMFAASEASYRDWLGKIQAYSADLRAIPLHADPEDEVRPNWINAMFPGLDGMFLYTLIREIKPKVYLEVGSGNSTRFVRQAVADGGLSTKVISIDPHPRGNIDALCDQVIRRPFEDVDESTYAQLLSDGDVVFIDNSHRSFQNSDVTVFFTETIELLPRGVYYGVHDICLPLDYPEAWADRFYNEQYLMAAYLLGGASGDSVVFPGVYVSGHPAMRPALAEIFDSPEFEGIPRHAGAFWMRRC